MPPLLIPLHGQKQEAVDHFSMAGGINRVLIQNLGDIYLKAVINTSLGTITKNYTIYNYGGSYRLAPNPAIDEVIVLAEDDRKIALYDELGVEHEITIESKFTEVLIYNQDSNLIKHKKFNENKKKATININGLKPGNYFKKIRNGECIDTKVLMKI